jgi:hypothetical protein
VLSFLDLWEFRILKINYTLESSLRFSSGIDPSQNGAFATLEIDLGGIGDPHGAATIHRQQSFTRKTRKTCRLALGDWCISTGFREPTWPIRSLRANQTPSWLLA